jgi:hypothetical protein
VVLRLLSWASNVGSNSVVVTTQLLAAPQRAGGSPASKLLPVSVLFRVLQAQLG